MADATQTATLQDMLVDAPRNWGKWGADDEVGSLNYLTARRSCRGVRHDQAPARCSRSQVKMANPEGDPVWPGRTAPCAR